MYEKGQRIPQNYTLAHMWYNLAASNSTGDVRDTAVKICAQIAEKMTPETIAEAQKLASEWKPKSAEGYKKKHEWIKRDSTAKGY